MLGFVMARAARAFFLAISIAALAGGCGPADEDAGGGGDDTAALANDGDGAPSAAARGGSAATLGLSVPAPPRPVVTTDERRHLLYEAVVQNLDATPATIERIDVVEPGRSRVIASYQDAALAAVLVVAGEASGAGPATLPPGGLAAVFLDVAQPADERPPHRLEHRFVVRRADRLARVFGPTVPVLLGDGPARVTPPLHGGNLLAGNGCCDGAHRRALVAIDGELFLSQRFAIDFVRFDQQGTFNGDPARNDSYFIYGADILAVAPGRIEAVHDGAAENDPTQPLPPFSLDTAAGNFVVQRLDDGRFALYAHLQPGSLRVRAGDRVRRGQVLGLVGNSGNSTEPHLHFHLTDGPALFASNGVPYVFDRFSLLASVDLTGPEPVVVPTPPPQERRNRLPLGVDFVGFP